MARATSDFTVPLVIALAADAALVIVLAVRANVGSPPPFSDGPPREERECGDGSVERLLDEVSDQRDEDKVGREIAKHIGDCGRWWFDPTWTYSLCAPPRFYRLLEPLAELRHASPGPDSDPQLARLPTWQRGDSPQVHVASELATRCGLWESDAAHLE